MFLSSSCASSTHNEKEIVAEWVGKEIIIPEQLTFQILEEAVDIGLALPDYRIVNYVDSTGCTSCRLKLPLWEETINEFRSLPNVEVECLTIVNAPNEKEIGFLIKRGNYLHPIALDSDNTFDRINNLPNDHEYHTFLLDSENRVLAIGNPVLNPKIKDLYKRIILVEEEDVVNKFDRLKSRSLGVVHCNSTANANFSIINTDSMTLHIQAIIPSCDCVSASSSSETILPNSANEICLTFSADSLTGGFSRYVDIYYNEKDNPDRFTVYGFTK